MPDKTTTLNLNKPLGSEVVDIDVLNENMDILDTTVKDVQDFMTQTEADLASAEARITALDNAATGIAAEERKRVTAESGRVTAEDTRIANETGRVSAEQARVSAENQRAAAETARAAAEANRVSAETAREQVIEDFVDTTDANKKDAEAYAVGTRGGTDVPDTDPTYHNNAKYYAGQASADAEAADAAKTTAVSTVESAIGNIRTEGTTQVSAVQTKGNEVLASIPDDYEALSTDVSALKSQMRSAQEDIQFLTEFHKSDLTWAQIQNIVRAGVAADWFKIGDQLEINWEKDGTVHKLPFDVVSFDPVLKEGETEMSPGMWLQSHYAGEGVQFSASNALYVADAALPAGVYHFTIGTNWGTHCVAGKSYQFELTKPLPIGGQIMIGRNNEIHTWGAPDQAWTTWRVHTFESNADVTPLETNIVLTEGTDGTDLGTTTSAIKYSESGINNLQRAAYGYNRWSHSANRQYYNSAEAKGAWWHPQNPFDRSPGQLASLDGYMAGFDADFLAVLGKIKVTTALNTVSDSTIGTQEDTYDTFFLPSLEQEYIVPQLRGVEGDYWPYWKERLELDSPQPTGSAGANANHIRYAYNAQTSAQYCRLRSASRGFAYYTWNVYTLGYAFYYYATYAYRGCPACVIC